MAKVSPWNRRISRLTSMGRHELFDRLRQYMTARADVLRYRGGNPFDFVADAEIATAAPMGRFFFAPDEVPSLCALLKEAFPEQAKHIILQAEIVCRHHFDLLGYENLDYGAKIDWHSDVVHGKRAPRKPWFKVNYLDFGEVGDSKITWELNRHQHFVVLAKAYCLSGNDKFAREIFAEWSHWHKENPYPIGLNWASSLELAYRSLAWMWTFFLLQQCPLFTSELRRQWIAALNLSGRHIETYLSTYFSPNTHLLGEALALFFIGTLFPQLPSASSWQRCGWNILQREATEQVRPDGFYFEQSTYYHVYAVDIFLHARILASQNGVQISPAFDQILQRMLNALMLLGRAGIPTRIGDDDGGRLFDPLRNRAEHLLDPLATGAVLYQRGDFNAVAAAPREETLWLLGAKSLSAFDALPSQKVSSASTALPDSGLYLMTDGESKQQLLIEAGPLGSGRGGHAHAAALNVSLIRNGHELLLDPGSFEYVGDSGERARLRGTGVHNTMQVDQRDQAEAAGPFSWSSAPRVKVEQWITGRQFDLFKGSHDGYSRLSSPVIHRRWVFHRKGKFWLVRDLAEGRGSHALSIAWHIGPALSLAASDKSLFTGEAGSLALLSAEGQGWSQSVSRELWSPAYGRADRASVLTFTAATELPADFATLLIAGESLSADLGQFVKIHGSAGAGVCAYRYSDSQNEHCFFFADHPAQWTVGTWASDAEFLYFSFDRETHTRTLILCNGSYADAGGHRLLSCSKRIHYAEVLSSGATVELFSSDPSEVTLPHPLNGLWAETDLAMTGNDGKRVGL